MANICLCAGEVLKSKLSPQILTQQLQRRLLPRMEIQQKQINQTQNVKRKSPKIEINDELEIDFNHLPEISNSLDVEEDLVYQGTYYTNLLNIIILLGKVH